MARRGKRTTSPIEALNKSISCMESINRGAGRRCLQAGSREAGGGGGAMSSPPAPAPPAQDGGAGTPHLLCPPGADRLPGRTRRGLVARAGPRLGSHLPSGWHLQHVPPRSWAQCVTAIVTTSLPPFPGHGAPLLYCSPDPARPSLLRHSAGSIQFSPAGLQERPPYTAWRAVGTVLQSLNKHHGGLPRACPALSQV